jgi:hypothetical protein
MPLPSPPDDVAAPAEQQAKLGAVYAELPKRRRQFLCTKCGGRECKVGTINEQHPPCECGYLGFAEDLDFNADEMRDFADRTHALRMEQAAPKAAPGVGNSGFDHQTAADFLSGKTVNDEAVRKFVQASRWAHDEKAALSATLLAMHGVLTSREAEIALLKKALLEAEAAPQQEAQEPAFWMNEKGHTWSHSDWKQFPKHRAKYPIPLYPHFPAPQPAPAPQGVSDAMRVPLDSLHADAAYLIGRLREGSMPYARVIEIIRGRIDAALAAQGGK